jgi:hypothetical protein
MRATAGFFLLALITITLSTTGESPQASEISLAVYDRNPGHVWNRLYSALRVREDSQGNLYGEDSLDLMLWPQSQHLLSQPSHETALRVLDEFLRTHAENLIRDPLKRAMLQRDLWAVFDWSVQQIQWKGTPDYGNEKRELQGRLAEVLRRLALTPEQIKALPDNYEQAVASGAFSEQYDQTHPQQPFLPPDLFAPRGPWVCIRVSPEFTQYGGVAKSHVFSVSGRSVFLVFVQLPEGRKATLDYFRALWDFPQPWVPGAPFADDASVTNPDLPSFPAGTKMALVRRMVLFDNQGKLVVSPVIESVQIRVYREITHARPRDFTGGLTTMARNSGQDFFEIRVSRPLQFSGKQGGLRATAYDETEPATFQTQGFDEIDGPPGMSNRPSFSPVMQRCVDCHSGGGITSFNSLDSLLKPNRRQTDPQDAAYGPDYFSESAALWWKENRYDWGLLNGYWRIRSMRASTIP